MNVKNKKTYEIGILGTGAWGSALANVLSSNNHKIIMWGIDDKEIEDINKGYNKKYFGEQKFENNQNIFATSNIDEVLKNTNTILLAVPSGAIFSVLNLIKEKKEKNNKINIINVAKGIEEKSNKFFSQIIKEVLGESLENYCSLIGPSFACEVMEQKFTMINIVGPNKDFLSKVAILFNNNNFRLVSLECEESAELFAALKNVLAIGIGIVSYFYPNENTKAAMLATGVKEISNIQKDPYIGFELAGIGDIFLTCSSTKSRNYSFGLLVAKEGLANALKVNNKTIEGYHAAKILNHMIEKNNLKNKTLFLNSIIEILYKNKSPKNILDFVDKY